MLYEVITQDPVICLAKEGGFRILVDDHDLAGALAADQMLNRAADSAGNIECRGNAGAC